MVPESWKTRAGWDEDRGDIVLDLLGDKVLTWAIQVKDTAGVPGTPEFLALADQIKAGAHQVGSSGTSSEARPTHASGASS